MIEKILFCHMAAFVLGFVLDLLLGDPYWLPHPVRLIGRWIRFLEDVIQGEEQEKRYIIRDYYHGKALVACVLIPVMIVVAALLILAYVINIWLGMALEIIFTYQLLAAKCLKVESMKVYDCLKEHDLVGARQKVSMIVGRDTEDLDEKGVIRAAVETVSENTTDAEVSPMLYLAIFGPIGGFFQKAVNTMDSMVGYKTRRYEFFGKAAALLDDRVNFIPARLAAILMVLAAYLSGKEYSGKNAWKVFKRDRYKHASPNSAQTESACAGALQICLGGNCFYFGNPSEKQYIGDAIRPMEPGDIVRANHLLYVVSFLAMFFFLVLLAAVFLLVRFLL